MVGKTAAAVRPGNYTQALDDFEECLKLQVKHLEADSRLLAETHYQLGLTYGLNLQYNQAIAELNRSSSVIKCRLGKRTQAAAATAAACFRPLFSSLPTGANSPDRQAAGAGRQGRGPGGPGGGEEGDGGAEGPAAGDPGKSGGRQRESENREHGGAGEWGL